jgi:hypothetical protein
MEADVAGVPEPVHPADLVAVERGDRYLFDALPGLVQLKDDLGVEVEVVRVPLERDLAQRGDPIRAVPAVPLAEIHPRHHVLEAREDAITDELVQRHAPEPSRTRHEHARPEDSVAFVELEGLDDLWQRLGRVLAVGVEHHDDVEPALDRPPVAGLLVASVTEIPWVADDLDR